MMRHNNKKKKKLTRNADGKGMDKLTSQKFNLQIKFSRFVKAYVQHCRKTI